MMLNILMTFAQYEREIIADRVRDKILAAKKRGKNCGGYPYLGYDSDPETKKLQINPQEAKTIRFIYQKYLEVGSAKEVALILEKQGFRGKVWTTKKGVVHDGQKINNHMIYRILRSPIYVGRVPHKKTSYPGEHEAIIDQATWDKVQETLKVNMNHTAGRQSDKLHPFTGLVTCGHCTGAMTLSHTVKYKNKKYHYYICNEDTKRNIKICPTPRIPASEFEKLILLQLEILLRTPTMLAKIDSRLDENGKNSALRKKMAEKAVQNLQKLWEVMIPYERYTLIHNIVDEIKVYSDHVRIEFNRDGIIKLLTEAGVKEYESNQNR